MRACKHAMCRFQVTEPSSTSLGSSSSCSISSCVQAWSSCDIHFEVGFIQFVSKPLHHRICSVHLHQIHLNLQTPVHQQKSCTTAAERRRPRFGPDINIGKACFLFPIAGWNQVIFEFSSNSKSAIFKPLWIDASRVLPLFQSCFFASFTSSFLTAEELKKKYEYNKYMICPFQGADTPDVQFIHSKLLLHSVFSWNWLNMFNLVSYYLVSMKPPNSAWHAISCRDPCVSGRQPGTNYLLRQPMSAPQNPGLCSLTLSCFPRSLFSKSLGRLRKWFK